ncbi:MAG: MgtC/SapB family protein [Gammaproteobacteria bacterium]|nr:MgtC/SapB family protein [Gammaproteobacteria bacterium]
MDDLDLIKTFATSLAVGLLIGLERERKADAKAGLRTFALIALSGTLSALLARQSGSPGIMAAALVVLGALIVAADLRDPPTRGDPGTTTGTAVIVCFGLGALLAYGYAQLAVALALATTALLYFKAELHGISRSLTRQDLVSLLQFATVTFIVLPILPDQRYGPHGALNPYRIWLMVVLVVGVSLAGYAALRLVGRRYGMPMVGLLGGLASSTATTLAFSRHTRARPALAATAVVVILLANLAALVRVGVMSGAVAPAILPQLLPPLGAGLAAGGAAALRAALKSADRAASPPLEVGNPTELKAALAFGALYAVMLALTAHLNQRAGAAGVYAAALVSGLCDMDAITLSSLQLFRQEQIQAHEASGAIVIAYFANLAFKLGLAFGFGGPALGRRVAPGFAATAAGLGLGWLAFGAA